MQEREVVAFVEHELLSSHRVYFNIHGSAFGKDGVPDFLTHDARGMMVGIECKVPGKLPVTNQWRQAIRMCKSGVRYIVAYDDFSIQDVDNKTLPIVKIGSVIGESEFVAATIVNDRRHTFEVII